MLAGDDDADARLDVEVHVLDAECGGQRCSDVLGNQGRRLHVGVAGQENRELVASEARHGVDFSDRGDQPGADLGEQLVAELVSERVVDLLEAVQVDQQQAHSRALATSGKQGLRQPVVQQLAIWQPGQ